MRTTLDLPDSLFKEVKMRAVQEGITLKDLLARYVEEGLRTSLLAEKEAVQPKSALPLPVAWEADGSVTPSRTNAELYDLLEEEDILKFHNVSSTAQP